MPETGRLPYLARYVANLRAQVTANYRGSQKARADKL